MYSKPIFENGINCNYRRNFLIDQVNYRRFFSLYIQNQIDPYKTGGSVYEVSYPSLNVLKTNI